MPYINTGALVNITSPGDPVTALVNKYNIRDMHLERDVDSFSWHTGYAQAYSGRSNVILKMDERKLEQLAHDSELWDRVADTEIFEAQMRLKHPAVQKAWENYQLLLELYK